MVYEQQKNCVAVRFFAKPHYFKAIYGEADLQEALVELRKLSPGSIHLKLDRYKNPLFYLSTGATKLAILCLREWHMQTRVREELEKLFHLQVELLP